MTAASPSTLRPTLSVILSAWHDPAARILNLDLLTVMIAVVLPWSTSAVSILAMVWLAALVPTLDLKGLVHTLKRPVCALPIALVALALVGTLWSEAPRAEQLRAIGPVLKLLMLPLLIYHFQRSPRAMWVFLAFLASCTLLMLVSWMLVFDPSLTLKLESDNTCGIFVKNYIDQGQEFTLCVIAMIYPVMNLLKENRRLLAGLFIAVALGIIFHMLFIVASRTSMAILPVMLAAFALRHLKWRGILAVATITVIGGVIWSTTPRMCRAEKLLEDFELYFELNKPTSAGLRLEFWKKSLGFMREAPVIGHGTGSIRGLFQQVATGGALGASANVVANPHNQTLAVGVQWGIVGVIALYAMWLLHLLLFRGGGLVPWIGLLVVVQNIASSLFNSHLFDFHQGWMYVLGVGVAGGTVLGARMRQVQAAPESEARP